MADLKTRKYSKEQMISYLEKHGSNLTEASNIAGTSPRTLGRYLSEGVIPSEWLTKIQAALKDRKPVSKAKEEPVLCVVCGKKVNLENRCNCDAKCLEALGIKDIPTKGWHWRTNLKGEKIRMYPICEKCSNKLDCALSTKKKTVKAKIATKKK